MVVQQLHTLPGVSSNLTFTTITCKVNIIVIPVQKLYNYYFPISLEINHNRLLEDLDTLLSRLGLSNEYIEKKCKTDFGFTINLTHLSELTGNDRWGKYAQGHDHLCELGINELYFTEHLKETQDLYLGQLIHQLYKQHPTPFQGRAQLVWLGAKRKYKFHIDMHTPHRYHVPLITNEDCYWMLKEKNKNEIYKLHMPVGNVWYVDPINIEHTFVNDSESVRLHLILTSGI